MRKFKIDWKTFHSTFPLFTYPLHNVSDKTGNVYICKSIDTYRTLKSRGLAFPLATPLSSIEHSLKDQRVSPPILASAIFPLRLLNNLVSSQLIQTIQSIQINYRIEIIFPTTKKSFWWWIYERSFYKSRYLQRWEDFATSIFPWTLELSMFKKIGLQLELFIIVDAGSALDYNGFTREREREQANESQRQFQLPNATLVYLTLSHTRRRLHYFFPCLVH